MLYLYANISQRICLLNKNNVQWKIQSKRNVCHHIWAWLFVWTTWEFGYVLYSENWL